MEKALFILCFFLPLGVTNSVKSPYKKKNYRFVLNETMAPNFPNNPHLKQDPQPLHQRRS